MSQVLRKLHATELSLWLGDITLQEVDAIVNAANSGLLGGGGVDGAIHRAGGPAILAECRQIRESQGTCPAGSAVITTGGNLKAKYVIHTVGPIWYGGVRGEPETLASAYRSSLTLALENKIKTIAFPSISTGAYSYPIDQAAAIAIAACANFCKETSAMQEIRFVLFDERTFAAYKQASDPY